MTLQLEDVRGKILLEDEFSPAYDLAADAVDQATAVVESAMVRAASAADSIAAPMTSAVESLRLFDGAAAPVDAAAAEFESAVGRIEASAAVIEPAVEVASSALEGLAGSGEPVSALADEVESASSRIALSTASIEPSVDAAASALGEFDDATDGIDDAASGVESAVSRMSDSIEGVSVPVDRAVDSLSQIPDAVQGVAVAAAEVDDSAKQIGDAFTAIETSAGGIEASITPAVDALGEFAPAAAEISEAATEVAAAGAEIESSLSGVADTVAEVGDAISDLDVGPAVSGLSNLGIITEDVEQRLAELDAATRKWDGSALFAAANEAATGIGLVGGASTLTADELERANEVVERAIEKYRALGEDPPEAVLLLEERIREIRQPLEAADEATEKWAVSLKTVAGSIAAIGLAAASNEALTYAGRLTDLSAQSNISVRDLQRFDFAARQVGSSMGEVSRAVTMLQARLDDAKVEKRLSAMGLSAKELQSMLPARMFEEIAAKIAAIEDPTKRVQAAWDIMGRGALRLMPLITADLKGMGDEAERSGAVLGEAMVAGADDAGDALERLSIQTEQAMRNALLPLTTWLVEQLPDAVGGGVVAIGKLATNLAPGSSLVTNILLLLSNYDRIKVAAGLAWSAMAVPVAVLAGIASAVAGLTVLNAKLETNKRLQDQADDPRSEAEKLGLSDAGAKRLRESVGPSAAREAEEVAMAMKAADLAARDAQKAILSVLIPQIEMPTPASQMLGDIAKPETLTKLREAQDVVRGLSAEVRTNLNAALKSGVYSTEELTKEFGLSEAAIKLCEQPIELQRINVGFESL